MSQSTDSETNKNVIPETPRITTDDKMPSTIPKQGIKRSSIDEHEVESDAKKIRHQLNEEVPGTILKAIDVPEFVSANKMINNSGANANVIPEISDEELLEMTIKFEMENPQ